MAADKKKNSFKIKEWICFGSIVVLAFLLRSWHWKNRVLIYSDSARDILVAREALRTGTIPPIASFSSAGPFVFGPQYYWLIMAVFAFDYNNWFIFYKFLILQSLFFVILSIWLGKKIMNSKFGLILGLATAFSPRQIFRSIFMTQHSIIGICSLLAIAGVVLFLKKRQWWKSFWIGFWVATAIMIHYQALALGIFILPVLFAKEKIITKIINLCFFALGFLVSVLPLIWWDSAQNFANLRNVLDYLLIGQYRFYIPNRWLWHIFDFWPKTVADIFGGNLILGGLMFYASMGLMVIMWYKRKLNVYLKWILVFITFYFFYLRYYRGEKFEGYLIYLHPLILISLAYLLFVISIKKVAAFFLMMVVFIFNSLVINDHFHRGLMPETQLQTYSKLLQQIDALPLAKEKYAVYDWANEDGQTSTSDASQSFSLFLSINDRLAPDGRPLVFCQKTCADESPWVEVVTKKFVYDPGKKIFLHRNVENLPMVRRLPEDVMDEILFWRETRPLKSTFDLKKYIWERI